MRQPDTDRMWLVQAQRLLDPGRLLAAPAHEYPAAAAAGLQLLYPYRGVYQMTQGYHAAHPAIDWGMPSWTELLATISGRVASAGYEWSGYAYHVAIISDTQRVYAICAHMPADGVRVKVGQQVVAGQLIGYSDNTGNSTGPHLHFETRRYPYRYGTDGFDPRPFLARDVAQPPVEPPDQGKRRYVVIKPVGALSVYKKASRTAKVVGHYARGQIILADDVIDYGPEDWVRTADGYCLKQINGKLYLRGA